MAKFFQFGDYLGEHGLEFEAAWEVKDSPDFEKRLEDLVVVSFGAFSSDLTVGIGHKEEARADPTPFGAFSPPSRTSFRKEVTEDRVDF